MRRSVWSAATWSGQSDEDAAWAIGSPEIPPGHLIVDSAAGQALIGETACVEWEQKLSTVGLRGVRVNSKVMNPKGVGGAAHPTISMMMPTMIDGLPWGVAVHCGRGGHPGNVAIEFSGETGSDDKFAHEQALPSTSQSSRSYASHTREPPHDRCDDGTDASHFPCTRRSFAPIWAVLASVCNGRYSRELNSRWQRPTRDER